MSPSALASQAAPAPTASSSQPRSRTLSFRRRRTKSANAGAAAASSSSSSNGAPSDPPPPLPTQISDKSLAEMSMVQAAQPTPEQRREASLQPPPFPDRPLYMACYCEENAWLLAQHLANVCSNRNAEARAKAALANRADAGVGVGVELPKEIWDAYVVVVSNSNRSVVMWSQRASSDPSGVVCWDYHVFLLLSVKQSTPAAESESAAPTAPQTSDLSPHKRRASLFRRSTSSLRVPTTGEAIPPLPQSAPTTAWVYDADSLMCGFDPKSATPAALSPCPLDEYIQGSFQPGAEVEAHYRPTFRVIPATLYLKYFSSDRSHMKLSTTLDDGTTELSWAAAPPKWAPLAGEGARSEGDLNNLFERYVNFNEAGDARYGSVLDAATFYNAAWLKSGLGTQPGRSLLDLPAPVDVWRAVEQPAARRAQLAVVSEVLARQPGDESPSSSSVPSTPPPPNWASPTFTSEPPSRITSPTSEDGSEATPRRRGGRIASPLFPAYAAAALAARAGRARGSYMGFEAAELNALARAIGGDEEEAQAPGRFGAGRRPPPPPPSGAQAGVASERIHEELEEEEEATAL